MKENIIIGLDIGSANIRVVVGQIGGETRGQIQIIGAAEHPSEGVNKGAISSIDDAVSSISACLEKVERMTGLPCEHAFVGVSGNHVISQLSHGVIAVAKADGEVRENDVERVLEAAQAITAPPNYEILHVIPRNFIVDNQQGIKDPVGMTGVRLEVDAQIIQGLSSQIKNLTKCIYRTGVDIDDLVFSILATAEAVLTKKQKELGVAILNIGGTTSTLAVFEEGDILATNTLPIGAAHITSDIAIGLRTSLEIAEQVKLEYGTALPQNIRSREEIHLNEFSENEEGAVLRKHLAEIIEARVEEIFKMVDKELKKIERSGKLPAGVILTGGGAKLPGLVEVAKREFRLPATISAPREVVSAIDKIYDPTFSTAVGLAIWGQQLQRASRTEHKFSRFLGIEEASRRIKRLLKSLAP